jgi:23S rRNA (uracil1939-C5)-methyltransferase
VVAVGQAIELAIDKPAHGGRMIGRHDGQVVLVRGAIPGERVRASVERVEARLAFATTVEVLEPSPDRREGYADARCGGCLLSHIAYTRQLTLKSEVVADAFARLGRVHLEQVVPITGSPERGYRMRARFHVRNAHAGFYREGTHEICDAGGTRQLADASVGAVEAVVASLHEDGYEAQALELIENISGDMRVAAIELGRVPSRSIQAGLERALERSGLTGCTARWPGGGPSVSGIPVVTDALERVTAGRASGGSLSRHAESFFQANRYLIDRLVTAVLDAVPADDRVLDLYAGVGLFSVALAGTGRTRTTAVEGDRSSGADLRRNADQFGSAVRVVLRSVEDYLTAGNRRVSGTVIVDPPRAGISRQAMTSLSEGAAARVVYVSCDPATMARDARRLLDAGYRLDSLRGFDLFPNTPHVELVGVFEGRRAD